jgi:thiol-activated cytolysin
MKYIFILLITITFFNCTNCLDESISDSTSKLHHPKDYVVTINTTRQVGNIEKEDTAFFNTKNAPSTRSSNDDYFTIEKDVTTSECVILPEYASHIWMGNVLTKNSVANCIYKPIIGIKKPIIVSLSLPGTDIGIIKEPSFSQYSQYLKKEIPKASFMQNEEFLFSVEQFTSYNELKSALGNNSGTDFLFWGNSESTKSEEHRISKATGIYFKFWQSSFTATMDNPDIPLEPVSSNMLDSAVYVNSITYGRFGLLTIETNVDVDTAKTIIQRCFHTIFTYGKSYLTGQDISFLESCDFKLLLIGGDGSSAVQSFTGFTGFIDHIKKGTFSSEQPGRPIFCTFANVADNSLAQIKFKYNIRREPLYVELIDSIRYLSHGTRSSYSIIFYADKSRIPTIANPKVKFNFKFNEHYKNYINGQEIDTTYFKTYNNGFYEKSIHLFSYSPEWIHGHNVRAGQGEFDYLETGESTINMTFLESPDYKLLNIKKIVLK